MLVFMLLSQQNQSNRSPKLPLASNLKNTREQRGRGSGIRAFIYPSLLNKQRISLSSRINGRRSCLYLKSDILVSYYALMMYPVNSRLEWVQFTGYVKRHHHKQPQVSVSSYSQTLHNFIGFIMPQDVWNGIDNGVVKPSVADCKLEGDTIPPDCGTWYDEAPHTWKKRLTRECNDGSATRKRLTICI